MFSPEPYVGSENLEVPSPKRRQPNVLKPTPISVEPTPEYQRFYNQERLGWPRSYGLEMSLPEMSHCETKPDSHIHAWKLGPLDTKACAEFAFKRKFKLTCPLHRARKIQCNCHDFSMLEEGYQMYVTARNQGTQEQISRQSTPEYPCPIPDAYLQQVGLGARVILGHYEARSDRSVQQRVLDEMQNDSSGQLYQRIKDDGVTTGPLSMPYTSEINRNYPISGLVRGTICSSNSVETTHNMHQDVFQDCVTCFGNTLIEKTAARVWIQHSLHILGPQALEQIFNEVLRCAVDKAEQEDSSRVEEFKYEYNLDRCFLVQVDQFPEDLFFRWVKGFFIQGGPSQSLVTILRRALYFDDRFKMMEIRDQIESHLLEIKEKYAVEFQLDWKPFDFFESQFEGHIPQIGTLVTLTGSAFYAQAATCKEYLKHNWPATWEPFLSALQSAIDTNVTSSNTFDHSPTYFSNRDEIKLKLMPDKTLSVLIRGTKSTIIDIAQQISWVSATLSLSPFGRKVAYCNTTLVRDASYTGLLFKVERNFAPLQPIEDPCWIPLFSNAVLAWGFPIPERLGETGLEISIDLMAAIAGVRHAVEYDGGVVMKGFSSMLIPLKRNKETDTVQWHLVSSHDEETRLSYREGVAMAPCSDRALLAEVDLQSPRTTRGILGWCNAAETVLGREDLNYENIDYSTTQEATRHFTIQSAGLGFQQFGAGQIEFTLGPKDGTCHFQRQGPYRMIVDAADKTPIALFDTGERRGWLVPASGVLLHIAQHRCWLNSYSSTGRVAFKRGDSFRQGLLENESMALFGDEKYKFKDMITDIWSILEFLLDQRVSASKSPGLVVKSPFQDVLQGYEFKAIVESRSPLKTKQCVIEKTSGGWASLVRDIDALVLFADGFEDLIRPVQGIQGLCHMWKTVPKHKDYLATTVEMLNDLYDVAGCRLSKEYLTSSRLQWHRGDSVIFEACYKINSWQCKCCRLQQIVPKASIRQVIPPGELKNEGGVIFGQPGSLLNNHRGPSPFATKGTSIYSQPNTTFSNRDNELDEYEVNIPSLWDHSTSATQRPILTPPLTSSSDPIIPYDESSGDESENPEVQHHFKSTRKRGHSQEFMEIDRESPIFNLPTPHKRLRPTDLTLDGKENETQGSDTKRHMVG
ncbi:hypothetical protein GQX73_g1229 [Xylaria multiplex]|uniref:Uncharacterized protein n=1 Tax=Xylaria multiplex TaxID=323545 RepID=A0A7C8MZT6_9PEZI|nr:hypothetical protein GQX73_g1229 [Xylaria multiplex]